MHDTITLAPPQTDLDFPLMKAISGRRTKRSWKDEDLSMQDLSNLLWAACGITQPETKRAKSRRTVPSACNSQEVRVYVALQEGLFLYEETDHVLLKILPDDIRSDIGTQKMMKAAPVGLIYVTDFSRMQSALFKDDEERWMLSATDTGFISQNVYLYCTAAGLSTAVLGLVDRDKLHGLMKLSDHEKITFTQVVGYLRD